MIFDGYGLPKDVGASDTMDSSRLAGIMALCGCENTPRLSRYVSLRTPGKVELRRHPFDFPANNPSNFSRDQMIPFVAGLCVQSRWDLCLIIYKDSKRKFYRAPNTECDIPGSIKKFPNGADILSPSVMNHLRLCAGLNGTFFGYLWLVLDILFNAIFSPVGESNQLLSMLIIAGPKWLKFYKFVTPKWKDAIKNYWSSGAGAWRQERDLAEMLIKTVDRISN